MSQVCIIIVRLKPDDYMYRGTRGGAYEIYYSKYGVWVGQKVYNPFEELPGPPFIICSNRRELYNKIDLILKGE